MISETNKHVLGQNFRGDDLSVQTDGESVDWTEALPNTWKFLEVDTRYTPVRALINPDIAKEVSAAHDNGEAYTMAVKGAPWELRGLLRVDENQRLNMGRFSVYLPTDPDAVDWGGDVGGTRNIVQVTMNGADPWNFELNPAFQDDLARGLEQEVDDYDGREEGGAYVVIAIDDESPWRIKYGQITIESDDGGWVVRSSPLMIAADELDWEFSFEEWAEE